MCLQRQKITEVLLFFLFGLAMISSANADQTVTISNAGACEFYGALNIQESVISQHRFQGGTYRKLFVSSDQKTWIDCYRTAQITAPRGRSINNCSCTVSSKSTAP